MIVCPSCGEENPDRARLCMMCGTSLVEAPMSREERKVVSVLFCDLVGFTSRSASMDVEDVRGTLQPYHALLRRELERHGGTVEKFIGDAVMALFGAPVAHEDDPERAVRAALAIRDALADEAEPLQVRIGVNTGEALVTIDARAAEGEGMAAGDVVNTAARIQTAAPVNSILVGERTHRATSHAIEYREAVPVVAKGKPDPVPVWEAIQPRSRFGVDLAQPPPVPLVGRQRELELLVSTLARVIEEQTAQLVTLVGVPGMGKTRLVGELFLSVEATREVVTWRQGRSLPYGDGVTFWALGEIVKAQAGILENDSRAVAEARLHETADLLAADTVESSWLAAHLRPLVGLEDAPSGARGEDRFVAWRRFLEALAEQRPLVLVFEDLHWADDDLLEFVDGLVDHVSGVPMLVLATARPELLDRRPGWSGGKPNAATVSLAPLAGESCEQLVTELLTRAPIPLDSREELLARIGGNPLYAEQYARAFLERGNISDLPETIQGIIAARLDALAPPEKAALQDAAVIGKLFWLGAVQAIGTAGRDELTQTLHRLERMQFVQRARRSSVAGDEEYAFRHVLIRDVSYGQIPRAHRGRLHLAAIDWLESSGRPDDLAETLAHHYTAALGLVAASDIDPRLASRAQTALREAGEHALSLSAYLGAARYFQASLDLLTDAGCERARVLLGLGTARFGADGSGDRELEAALDEARVAGDHEMAAEAALALRVNAWYRGDSPEADRWLQTAFDVLGDRPDSRAKAHALAELFRSNNASGHREDTIRRGPDALALVERVGPDSIHARILNSIGTSRVHLGDPGGMDEIRRGIEIARAAGALEQVHSGMNNLSGAQLLYGDLAAAVHTYEELIGMVERVGREVDRRWARISLAGLRLAEGRWDDAAALANRFLDESESGAPHYLDGVAYSIRAQIRLARDDVPGAIADADRAVKRGRDTDLQVLTATLVCRAAVQLEIGDVSQALAPLDELLGHGAEVPLTIDYDLVPLAWTAYDLGRDAALQELLAIAQPVPWVRAALLIVDGAAADAAELLTHLGHRPGAAYAHLRAAEQAVRDRPGDARAHLEVAVPTFSDLEATRFLRRAEAISAALAAAEGG